MDQNQMNQVPIQSAPKKSAGPVIGIIIIIIVLVIGALYFYGGKLNRELPAPASTTGGTPSLSSSDEMNDIATDLSATVVNSVDADVNAIAQEFNTTQ